MLKNGVLAALILLALAGFLWWQQAGDDDVARPTGDGGQRPVAVQTAPVERGGITGWAIFTGSLSPAAQFDVAARTAGRLDELLVDIGDEVEQGQLIARLDDEEEVQQLEQARAELAVARASLAEAEASRDAARRSLSRTRELREQRVASQSELDTAETEARAQQARVQLAESQVSQQEAAVRAAEIRLSYTEISARWQGEDSHRVVGQRYADEGTLLQTNDPVLSLVSLDPLRGIVFAADRDYARLRVGQQVEVRSDALPGRTFSGELARLAPIFREDSRQAQVEIRVPNAGGELKPGMFIRARVRIDGRDDATIIPLDAVITHGGETGVFRIGDDSETAEFVPLELGIRETGRVEVLEPAITGRVVTLGQHLLSDGVPVRPADDEEAPVMELEQ
ncbi:efflux RND transporter periplasmic adaptor subunit [Methylonatrum kenyense]|uniref:efflux RND transporter periplasmic adaptor subunit n=1 Tax=Methylonatrum kenyense TaxID=455253 RepID=UPI0020BF79EE|nr:efflux RND transporter periplasmic adaptor subunit [Methylonatrum kenyense]MCK8517339.1 efflux RND transporter periplasmic adaptor subunit [Methylonatrum kenyense]